LDFDEAGLRGDFCAVCNPPKDWPVTYDEWGEQTIEIWFWAYATEPNARKGYGKDYELWVAGYGYDCYVDVATPAFLDAYNLAHFSARDSEEAERLLQVAADALYGEEW